MIQHIKKAAKTVGIIAIITNSKEKIETQLNRVTRDEMLPIMLVSWDINTNLVFDSNGFLENPSSDIVALLVQKPADISKDEAELTADKMSKLFQKFIQQLYNDIVVLQKSSTPAVSAVSYILVPEHGAGKHAGVLAKWTMRSEISICKDAG